MSTTHQDPKHYWRSLVTPTSIADVELVGHPDMGRAFNQQAYRVRWGSIHRSLQRAGCDPTRGPIFEAAYGVGYYLSKWRELGCTEVRGIDIAEQAYESARAIFPEYDLRLGDISSLSVLPDWDRLCHGHHLVTAIDVLYHVLDDELALRAVQQLGELVRPGGFLLLTDKFLGLPGPVQETAIVRRRPLAWYDRALAEVGMERALTSPLLWCMDPSTRYGGFDLSRACARTLWIAMRAPLKYLPRNGRLQEFLGGGIGAVGRQIDLVVLPRIREAYNLSAAVYVRDGPAMTRA